MPQHIFRGAKLLCKYLIDNRDLGVGTHLRVGKFTPVENTTAHRFEVIRQHGNHHGTLYGWTSIDSPGSPNKACGVQRRNSVALALRTPGSRRMRASTSSK